LIFIRSLKPLNKAQVCVPLVFVVFVRTGLFVEQKRSMWEFVSSH
jgi:hypothetical protein